MLNLICWRKRVCACKRLKRDIFCTLEIYISACSFEEDIDVFDTNNGPTKSHSATVINFVLLLLLLYNDMFMLLLIK